MFKCDNGHFFDEVGVKTDYDFDEFWGQKCLRPCSTEVCPVCGTEDFEDIEITDERIDEIKANTNLCDTFCCYENCRECVRKYLKSIGVMFNED